MLSRDRAMQQRGVLGHHRNLRAQTFLGHRGDVLTVDQDAAAFEIEETQQQVDQGRLAGARAADQTDLLARRAPSGSGLRSRRFRGHSRTGRRSKRISPRGTVERRRVRPVAQPDRPSDRRHALLHHADVFEDLVTCCATQPAMLTICQASGSAIATVPTPTCPRSTADRGGRRCRSPRSAFSVARQNAE